MLNNPTTSPSTMMLSRRQFFLIFALIFFCFGVIMFNRATSMVCTTSSDIKTTGFDSVDQRTKRAMERQRPFIFIGGMPRSGTTLMRAMLDAHPAIRCGEETRLVPRLLAMRQGWLRSDIERKRLEEAGVTETVVESAIAAFIYEIIVGHGDEADFLCNKDPFTLRDVDYLSRLFPNSKYLLMIRDGRATIHSIITGKVTISGFDLNNPRQCLGRWNQAIEIMYNQCVNAGPARCYQVRYENLVLHPENVTREIMQFLGIKWTDELLKHEEHIGKDIKLSKIEPSTAHVVNPINIDSLTKWVGKYPPDVIRDMATIAPMLLKLGYDPNANPPDFGKPDEIVIKKTKDLHDNAKKWFDRALVAVGGDASRVNMPAGMNMTMMNISSIG